MPSVAAVLNIHHDGRKITGRDEDRPEWIPIRAWRVLMKSGFMKAGQHWADVMLPLHFTRAAYFRYPDTYKRRSNSYFRRHFVDKDVPRDEMKHAVEQARVEHEPLVFTGQLRALAQNVALRAYQTRVSVVIPTPSYVSSRKRSGTGPDLAAELTAVNSQEVQSLSAVVQREVDRNLAAYLRTKQLP